MARHIMAVCVVCLLCADHLPCQEHIEPLLSAQALNHQYSRLNAIVYNTDDLSSAATSKPQPTKNIVAYTSSSSDNRRRRRSKRHSSGHENNVHTRPEITDIFLKRIFEKFGSNGGEIQVENFHKILNTLGLHQLLPQQQKRDYINDNSTVSRNFQDPLLQVNGSQKWDFDP